MTADQQRRAIGISAEAYEGLVIIDADRPFMSLTPEEVQIFHGHLRLAYRRAYRKAAGGGRHNVQTTRELVP